MKKFGLFFVLAGLTIATTVFIAFYCDLFYDLGIFAKDRLLNSPILAFCVTPIFFWISAYMCKSIAINASGSNLKHIREALARLQETPEAYSKISHLLSFRLVCVNAISSLISTLGGGSLGREGPSIYMGGGIFAESAYRLKKYFPSIDLKTWIYTGMGIGFAVAFAAPFSGLIYIMEKLIYLKEKNYFRRIFQCFFALILVAVILINHPPLFNTAPVPFEWGYVTFLLILLSILCGFSSVLFLKSAQFFYEKFIAIKSPKWHLIPIFIGLVVALMNAYSGIYAFSGGIKTMSDALNTSDMILSEKEVVGRILNTLLTFISGCAGGLVAPAVTIGAGIGSLISQLTSLGIDPRIFMLSGMAAFLTPVIGLPIVTAVVVVETTSQSFLIFPFLILPSLVAFYSAKFLEWRLQK